MPEVLVTALLTTYFSIVDPWSEQACRLDPIWKDIRADSK
ncbi:hypothetical protein TIFTF001_054366, partial [Ficus carica]